jgi:hypothetical protein
MLIVIATRRGYMPPERSGRTELLPAVHGVCGSRVRRNRWAYVKQIPDNQGDRRKVDALVE